MSLTKTQGIEPITTITFPWGSYTNKNGIISVSNTNNQVTNLSSTMSLSVTMDDTDGIFLTKMLDTQLQGIAVTVTLTFVDETPSIEIIEGIVTSDIVWDEGKRQFSFSIESKPYNGIVGYAPQMVTTSGIPTGYGWDWGWTIENWPYSIGGGYVLGKLNKQNATKAWPICWGTVLKVPAVRMTDIDAGTLADAVTEASNSFEIIGGEEFKQNEEITIIVGGVAYKGQFNNSTTFIVSEKNSELAYSILFYNRDFTLRPVGDPDEFNSAMAWIVSPCDYRGRFVKVLHKSDPDKTFAAFVTQQEGRKLYFAKKNPWLIDENYTVDVFAGALVGTWEDEHGIAYTTYRADDGADMGKISFADKWYLPKGSRVFDAGTEIQYYVVNMFDNGTIHAVYAYRTVDNKRRLEQVPTAYYVVSSSSTAGAHNVMALLLNKPLSWYKDEGWEDELYVTLTSRGSANTSEAISDILDDYTDLTPDATTFTSVEADVTNYPMGFALLTTKDALKLCEEIAWQARCSIYRRGSDVFIKYLSEAQSTEGTLDETIVLEDSAVLSFTAIEDIATVFVSNWQEHYAEDGSRSYRHEKNTDLYGVIERDFDFAIYNHASLIRLSTAFWANRYANIWRQVKVELPLLDYDLKPNDRMDAMLDVYPGTQLFIRNLSYNLNDNNYILQLEGACKMGTIVDDTSYWLGDPAIGGENAPPNKATGITEKDYIVFTLPQNIPSVNDVRYINDTGIILYPCTVWKRGEADADGYVKLEVMEATDDKDRGITASELIYITTETAVGAKGIGFSCNNRTIKIKYDDGSRTPKVGEYWSPSKDSEGMLVKGGHAFIVTKNLGNEGVDKFLEAITPSKGKVGDIEFRQEDGDMPANGEFFQEQWIEYQGVMVTGCKTSLKTGNTGTYSIQLWVDGAPVGSVITQADKDTWIEFPTAVMIKAETKYTCFVTSSSGCEGFVALFTTIELRETTSV